MLKRFWNLKLTIIHVYTSCSFHNSPCNDFAPFVCGVDCSGGPWRFSGLPINGISTSGAAVHLLGSVGSVNKTCKLNKITVQIYSQSCWIVIMINEFVISYFFLTSFSFFNLLNMLYASIYYYFSKKKITFLIFNTTCKSLT